MIKIGVGNSYSRIQGLTPQQEKTLGKTLSYTVGGSSSYFGRGFVKKKSLLSKYGEFPTGLLHRIGPALDNAITYYSDFRIKPILKVNREVFTANSYRWQEEAVKTAVEATRGIISAPTGTGKSQAMALLIHRLNLFTLVIVPSLEIKKQLEKTLYSYGIMKTVVENIDSKTLKSKLPIFDCLIIDECHHAAAKTYQKLNKTAWKGIYYRYFFTATPFRNDSEEQLLFESIAGQVIYKLDYQTAIREGYIVPIEAYYYILPKQKTDAYTYREVYNELVINNTARNTMIVELLTTLHSTGKSTLCLVKEVKHGQILSDITGLPFVHGMDDDSRKYIDRFNKGQIKVLIGTTGILGEGIDTKPCEYVVVTGLGKAKSQFMQQIGRSVRKYPGKESAKVIIFRDTSHKFLTRHFNEQKKILVDEYGITAICLNK